MQHDKLLKANRLFVDEVWPKLGPLLGGGEIYSVEANRDEVCTLLDTLAGLDWLQVRREGEIELAVGLAARIQWGDYSSFTVRASLPSGKATEEAKRKKAVEVGALCPLWTCQAYFDDEDRLIRAAAIRTDKLIEAIQQINPPLRRAPTGELFRAVWWDTLEALGYKLVMVDESIIDSDATT